MSSCFYNYIRENSESLFTKFQRETYFNRKKVYDCTVETLNLMDSDDEIYKNLDDYYMGESIGLIFKAIRAADKDDCIYYLKNLSDDDVLKKYVLKTNSLKIRFIGTLIVKRKFGTAYFICNAWASLRGMKKQ